MTATFNIRKKYSTVERIDVYEHSIEIIIVPLKERATETNLFLEINILLMKKVLKQWMTARSLVKIITVSFQDWMTATLSVTNTVILLQRKDGCNWCGEINRSPFKNSNPKRALPRK